MTNIRYGKNGPEDLEVYLEDENVEAVPKWAQSEKAAPSLRVQGASMTLISAPNP